MSSGHAAETLATVPADLRCRWQAEDRKSTRLNSSHLVISYAVFCLKKKKTKFKPLAHRRDPMMQGRSALMAIDRSPLILPAFRIFRPFSIALVGVAAFLRIARTTS